MIDDLVNPTLSYIQTNEAVLGTTEVGVPNGPSNRELGKIHANAVGLHSSVVELDGRSIVSKTTTDELILYAMDSKNRVEGLRGASLFKNSSKIEGSGWGNWNLTENASLSDNGVTIINITGDWYLVAVGLDFITPEICGAYRGNNVITWLEVNSSYPTLYSYKNIFGDSDTDTVTMDWCAFQIGGIIANQLGIPLKYENRVVDGENYYLSHDLDYSINALTTGIKIIETGTRLAGKTAIISTTTGNVIDICGIASHDWSGVSIGTDDLSEDIIPVSSPQNGILDARVGSDDGSNPQPGCGLHKFDNVTIKGYFSIAAFNGISAEVNIHSDCNYYNYTKGGKAVCCTGQNEYGATSVFNELPSDGLGVGTRFRGGNTVHNFYATILSSGFVNEPDEESVDIVFGSTGNANDSVSRSLGLEGCFYNRRKGKASVLLIGSSTNTRISGRSSETLKNHAVLLDDNANATDLTYANVYDAGVQYTKDQAQIHGNDGSVLSRSNFFNQLVSINLYNQTECNVLGGIIAGGVTIRNTSNGGNLMAFRNVELDGSNKLTSATYPLDIDDSGGNGSTVDAIDDRGNGLFVREIQKRVNAGSETERFVLNHSYSERNRLLPFWVRPRILSMHKQVDLDANGTKSYNLKDGSYIMIELTGDLTISDFIPVTNSSYYNHYPDQDGEVVHVAIRQDYTERTLTWGSNIYKPDTVMASAAGVISLFTFMRVDLRYYGISSYKWVPIGSYSRDRKNATTVVTNGSQINLTALYPQTLIEISSTTNVTLGIIPVSSRKDIEYVLTNTGFNTITFPYSTSAGGLVTKSGTDVTLSNLQSIRLKRTNDSNGRYVEI